MLAVATFWLLLCLPGFVVLRRFCPAALDGGLLSGIALGYLATFLLLSPVSIVGYLFHLPIAVLSVAIVIFEVVALIALLRGGSASWRTPKVSLFAVAVFAFIACDMILGLRAGSYIGGDAAFHVARVHMLLANGFCNWDPYVAGGRFEPIYHTNLFHALMAAAGVLTSHTAVEVWAFTLFWAKLAATASIYHLASVVLGRRWIAWTAAATFTAFMGPSALLVYPNNITVFALLALGLAFAVEALQGQPGLRPALGLAATAAVLPQFHGLCYVFLVLVVGPVMLARLAHAHLRRLSCRRELLAGLLALGVGAPWLAPHMWDRVQTASHARDAQLHASDGSPRSADDLAVNDSAPREQALMYKGFVHLRGDRLMYDPNPLKEFENETLQLLLALVLGLFSRRRSQFLAVVAMTGVVLAVLYVPAICTVAVHAAQRGWIVARLTGVFSCLKFAVFPGAVLLLLAEGLSSFSPRFSPRMQRLFAGGLRWTGLAAALGFAYHFGLYADPGIRETYWNNARTAWQLNQLENLAKMETILRKSVPPGAILAAETSLGHIVGMVCNCYPLAVPANRGDYGVPDMERRRRALSQLVYLDADLKVRIKLARRYGVRHIFVYHVGRRFGQRLTGIYAPITSKVVTMFGMSVLTIDVDHPARVVSP